MKIKIINHETFVDNYEINIGDNLRVDDIKYSVGGDNVERFLSLDLIYRNCVLNESRTISFYKIQENDEIWMGKIEDYLENNDIIVDVFMVGVESELHHLIVKNHSTIADVVSGVQKIFPGLGYSYLWQTDGKEFEFDKSVTEIESAKGGHKIIFQCSNGTDRDFEECCKIHDQYLMEKYFSRFHSEMAVRVQTALWSDRHLKREILLIINQLMINEKLNIRLSALPKSFHISKFLFCMKVANRVFSEYRVSLISVMERLTNEIYNHMMDYVRVALRVQVLDFVNCKETEKTMKDIAVDVTQFILHINKWNVWARIFHDNFLLSPLNNNEIYDIDHHIDQHFFTIGIKRLYKYFTLRIPKELTTVRQIKKEIFIKTGTFSKNLYFIDSGSDHKREEDQNLEIKKSQNNDNEFLFEIIMNMDDIETLRDLASGGFGQLKLVKNKTTKELFVLKVQIENDSENKRDLYRDISMQYLIDMFVNAVKSIGLFHDEGTVCLGLEYMSGGSLRSYLQLKKEKKLSEEETAKITHQILTQLADIHNLGIIHRDIKPENIAFDEHFNAKLIDYGISKRVNSLSEDELKKELMISAPGNINYLAPEVLKEYCYNQKADIWSLGVVVTEMVTGKKPFGRFSIHKAGSLIKKNMEIDVKLDSRHSREIKDFVKMCLNRIPEERPTASELIQEEFIQNYLKNNNIIKR